MKRVQIIFIQQGMVLANVHSCFTRVIMVNVYREYSETFKLKTGHQAFQISFSSKYYFRN